MKFRKKPVTIEAVQIPKDGMLNDKIDQFLRGEKDPDVVTFAIDGSGVTIKTLEGDMKGDPGDWIIRGVEGELYPCKPDIFKKTYNRTDYGIDEQIDDIMIDPDLDMDQRNRIIERLNQHRNTCQAFVDKSPLTLTVNVETLEQADELISWLYSDEKPMSAKLQQISWDQELVSGAEAKLIRNIRGYMQEQSGGGQHTYTHQDLINHIQTQIDNIEFLGTDVASSVVERTLTEIIQRLKNL